MGVLTLASLVVATLAISPALGDWLDPSKPRVRQLSPDDRLSLMLERQLSSQDISLDTMRVHVHNRTAYLGGFAYDSQQKAQAVAVARQIPGVLSVDDKRLRHVVDMPAIRVGASVQDRPFDSSQAVAMLSPDARAQLGASPDNEPLQPRRTPRAH